MAGRCKIVGIRCPVCGARVDGHIKWVPGMPYAGHFGYCKDCDYHILESEFEEI